MLASVSVWFQFWEEKIMLFPLCASVYFHLLHTFSFTASRHHSNQFKSSDQSGGGFIEQLWNIQWHANIWACYLNTRWSVLQHKLRFVCLLLFFVCLWRLCVWVKLHVSEVQLWDSCCLRPSLWSKLLNTLATFPFVVELLIWFSHTLFEISWHRIVYLVINKK